jgi:hypothetical protein
MKNRRTRIQIKVLKHRAESSLPAGPQIFYLCLRCHVCVPSSPQDAVSCSCGNIHLDPDEGRGGAEDEKNLLVLSVD